MGNIESLIFMQYICEYDDLYYNKYEKPYSIKKQHKYKNNIHNCHICNKPSDDHKDCKNDACHILFIQCEICDTELNGCCSVKCKEIASLPLEKQKLIRKNQDNIDRRRYFKSPKE